VIVLTALAAIFVGSTGLPPNWIDRAFFVAGAAWAFGFVAAGNYEIAFLCPHCGKRFFFNLVVFQRLCQKMRSLRLAEMVKFRSNRRRMAALASL
jgi:hypothetical protein